MPLRPFGSCGFMVSPLGLGTVGLGRDKGLKLAAPVTIPDDAAATRLIDVALDLGVNLIDTAPAYGNAEERLGNLLRGRRERVVLSTKAGEAFDNATGESCFDFSPEAIRASFERSLMRLGTDRIDIGIIHSDGDDVARIQRDGVLDVLAALKAEGKLRAIGMSTKTVEGGLLALERGDCAMVTFNPAAQDELPVIRRAAQAGKAILVKKPLASGHTGAEESLRLVLGEPGVTAAVVGTTSPVHLAANVSACLAALSG